MPKRNFYYHCLYVNCKKNIIFAEEMQRLTSELSGLFEQSHCLEEKIRNQLGSIGFNL